MGIILTILGICFALFSIGFTFFTFTYVLASLPTMYVSSFTINLYWNTAWVLMIGAPLLFLLFGASRLLIKYKIIRSIPVGGDVSITFYLNWLKKFLLLHIPLDLGEIRAEVRYRYGEVSEWQHATSANWKQRIGVEEPITLGSKISIRGTMRKFISIFEITPDGQIFTIHPDRQPLPNHFGYKINLIYESNDEDLCEWCGSY